MVHVIRIALEAERRVRQLYPEISSHSFFLVKQTKFYTFPEDFRRSPHISELIGAACDTGSFDIRGKCYKTDQVLFLDFHQFVIMDIAGIATD